MIKKVPKSDSVHLQPHLAWLLLGTTFIFGLFFMLATFVPVSIGGLNDKISGWSWSPMTSKDSYHSFGYGYTSFNDCYNVEEYGNVLPICLSQWIVTPPDLPPAPYGLTIDFPTKEITGWVWNQGVGWICFGNSCCNGFKDFCIGGTPDGSSVKVTYDDTQDPSPISGWAKIIASTSTPAGVKIVEWGSNGWISLRGTPQDGSEDYGLTFSTTTLEIRGLAWNGFTDTGGVPVSGNMQPYHGYGWLCINATSTWPLKTELCEYAQVTVNIPFIKTEDGDVYSHTNISPDLAPPTGYSATYLILAGGNIANFTSEEKYINTSPPFGESYIQPSYSYPLSLPKESTNFFNVLGYLDVPGISQSGTNKYGPSDSYTGTWYVDGIQNLGGKRVIINAGNLVLGKDEEVKFNSNTNGGATTFIVDGDLIIRDNVTYSTAPVVNDFKNLPSVAYIVRGDVLIYPTVIEVAGNFIVIGSDEAINCNSFNDHCGTIYTVADGNPDDGFPLTVHGIMMAKKFNFLRSYATILKQPSEKVIYDGRLLVNPPPGLADFAKGLPIWSETSP